MSARSLLISHASGATPDVQRRRERALLEAGALGELHLHASTLAGEVLGLGAFHLEPGPRGEPGTALLWRRSTGGRAIAAGDGFLLVTLGLPHRSALVADDRWALAPEQVMNRCVRGLLAWLRKLGVDPVYPGLDLVTASRRALAHVSFAEGEAGPTLFQAIVALRTSLATTPALLDRVDPQGVVPAHLLSSSQVTTLAELQGTEAQGEIDLAAIAAQIAAAYAEVFDLETEELDDEVTKLMLAEDPGPLAYVPRALAADARVEVAHGLLGPVTAAAHVEHGVVADFALTGDFLAPPSAIRELAQRLIGGPATASAAADALRDVLDGRRNYLLGLRPAELHALVARGVGAS
ncbi:MAG TPA: lipoate protein ligase C-terminal domain-containing protein [Candidatus Binatia bacterium]